MEDKTSLDHGSSISGIGLLLNVEKISNEIDIDDMEKKVKNMFIENITTDDDHDNDSDNNDIIREYEEAMEEIETVIDEVEDGNQDDIDEEDEEEEEEDNKSLYNPAKYHGTDSLYIQKTREEQLQNNISKVLESVPKMNIDMFFKIMYYKMLD